MAREPLRAIIFAPMDDLPPMRKRMGRSLPHWTQDGRPNFVTMRLGDALPETVVQGYKDDILERIAILERIQGRRATPEERSEIRRRCAGRVERYLDAGHGECLFRHPEAARIVQRSIQMYAGTRYDLDAWCVMPSHAHLVLTPFHGWKLEKITYDLKHGSSRLINRALERKGIVWQNESFDHLVRSDEHLGRFQRYVLANPAQAGLKDWGFVGVG